MITDWQDFLHGKLEHIDQGKVKSAEEEGGIDVDQDKEKGESPEHVAKFEKAHKSVLEFFQKRKAGAAKIANDAHAKGTPASQLTAWHFDAKAGPYSEVLSAIRVGKPESYFKSKMSEAMSRVHGARGQREFQAYMGVLEVWGETFIKLFGGK